jgi:predicted transposase/invertase (TIGR01784 family)
MAKNLIRFDWAMKKLLRSKANFGILEGFLSELLGTDLKILNLIESESNKENDGDKNNRVDILVMLQNGEIVLIEIQASDQADYFHRMLYGSSKIVTEYLHAGSLYGDIKKVYSVNILYFDLGHGKDYIYHGTTRFVGIHENDQLELSDRQKELYKKEAVFSLYPEYYLIKVNQFNDVAKNTLDEWIYFLKNEEIKDTFKAKGLLEAKNTLSELKLPDSERAAYREYVDNVRHEASIAMTKYDNIVQEGRKLGRAEGEKIGIEKGKIESQIEIAKKMKDSGMSREVILELTGIDMDQV